MTVPAGAVSRAAGAINHFFPKIDPLFAETFFRRAERIPQWVRDMFHQKPITDAYVVFHLWSLPPEPEPMSRGEGVADAGLDELTMTVHPHKYKTRRIPIHHDDSKDSNAPKTMEAVTKRESEMLSCTIERILAEMLEQSASTYLNSATSFKTKFDSSATSIFSNSHSYFGQTMDNIVASTGNTTAAWEDDWWSVIKARRDMPDSNGRPMYGLDEIMTAAHIIAPKARERQLTELWRSQMTVRTGNTAPQDNVLKAVFGNGITPHVWPELTNTSRWYAAFISENQRPFLWGAKEAIRRQRWTEDNSDYSRSTEQEGERYLMRGAAANGDPESIIRVGA